MKFTHQALDISMHPYFAKPNLHFRFKGKFTTEASRESCKVWVPYLQQSLTKSTVIWDCTEMNGFEPGARTAWMEGLSITKVKIKLVCVIAQNIMIRSAAQLMLKAYGLDSMVAKKEEELIEKVQ